MLNFSPVLQVINDVLVFLAQKKTGVSVSLIDCFLKKLAPLFPRSLVSRPIGRDMFLPSMRA